MVNEKRTHTTEADMKNEQVWERATMVEESDAMCEGCGADPRANDSAAIRDPRWFMETTLHRRGEFVDTLAHIRCPACW